MRGRGRAKVKKLCAEPSLLLLAACLQQGSHKEKEEEQPREAQETVSEAPRGDARMSIVAASTASPAKRQISLKSMFGWGSGGGQAAVASGEANESSRGGQAAVALIETTQSMNAQLGEVSGRRRSHRAQKPWGSANDRKKKPQRFVFVFLGLDLSGVAH